jgi:hypothetical protein
MTSSLRAGDNGLLKLLLGRVGLSLSLSLSVSVSVSVSILSGFGMGNISLPWQQENVELKICICACRAVIIKYLAKIRKRKDYLLDDCCDGCLFSINGRNCKSCRILYFIFY